MMVFDTYSTVKTKIKSELIRKADFSGNRDFHGRKTFNIDKDFYGTLK